MNGSVPSFASPKHNNSLLWKLILRPGNFSKEHSTNFKFLACSISFSKKRIKSSAYWRMERPPSTRSGIKPLIRSLSLALDIKIEGMSPTKLKSNGERGSPCLKPYFVWKKFPISSFKLTPTLPPLDNTLNPRAPFLRKALQP